MRIAVLGGGNGALAAAADLTEQGHEVRHWRRDAQALRAVINLEDAAGMREIRIARACADMGDAVRGAQLVFLPDPAFTQEDNARRLAPHLADGQVVFLAPGTFGAYAMREAMRTRCALAETGTLPWLTRKHGPGTAAITARATRLPTGVYPARPGERCGSKAPPVRACVVLGFARVTAKNGTSGWLRVAVTERRRRGGSALCLGKRYEGPFTSDVRGDAGTGRLEIRGWGVAALHLERNVLVTTDPPKERALCLAQTGTWVGLRGAIRGEGGRFTTRGPGRVLVFES